MDAEGLINRFLIENNSGTAQLPDLLAAVRERSVSQRTLATQSNFSRKTVNQIINELIDVGLITEAECGYRLTGAGAITLYQYSEAIDEIGQDTLQFLGDSQNRMEILQALQNESARKADLAAHSELPSRSTVGRSITSAKERGLVSRTKTGNYMLTTRGKQAINTYERLMRAFTQILDKSVCLQNLGVECAELPAIALEGEKMVVGTPSNPLTQVTALIEFLESLDSTDVEHIRTFSSYFDLQISRAFLPLMKSNTRIDIVSPASALQQIPTATEAAEHVRHGLDAQNVHWYLYPGELPVGLMTVDREHVIAGPKTVSDATEISGTIYGSDPALSQWAVSLHESFSEDSYEPFEYLVQRLQTVSADLLEKASLTQAR